MQCNSQKLAVRSSNRKLRADRPTNCLSRQCSYSPTCRAPGIQIIFSRSRRKLLIHAWSLVGRVRHSLEIVGSQPLTPSRQAGAPSWQAPATQTRKGPHGISKPPVPSLASPRFLPFSRQNSTTGADANPGNVCVCAARSSNIRHMRQGLTLVEPSRRSATKPGPASNRFNKCSTKVVKH